MMRKLYVYADFDWLTQPVLVGELNYESIRGSDSYGFRFDNRWLARYGGFVLSDDLSNFAGPQYTKPGKDIFGCFADALPDRWGRTLLKRREQICAMEEERPVRRLSSFDFLVGIDDRSRIGGFRFKESPDADFISTESDLLIPPITSVRELIAASLEIERSEESNLLPEKKWILQLVQPGTSLGGARPKAVVADGEGALYVAKFPSRNDDYDVALWEHLCHLLAAMAGINASETSVLLAGARYHTLLSKRFDRTGKGRRVHFASAMTLLGLTDGSNADTGNGYLDIVDFIIQGCCDVERNLRELYRRVAFNICVGNTDDHFRNHGFLLTPRGWTLSPAYDMNPTLNGYQSILVTPSSSKSDIGLLLKAAGDYMIPDREAERIVSEVVETVGKWRAIAVRCGIAKRELQLFEQKLDKCKL